MGDWTAFFAAELGAAAALAGLVIVAISINVQRILSDATLPGRAAETLVAPTGVLIACSCALVPRQPGWLFGVEAILTGALIGLAPVLFLVQARRAGLRLSPHYTTGRLVIAGLSSLPFLIAGILLMTGSPAALYWMVPGVIVSLLATVLNAWVLLIEILR